MAPILDQHCVACHGPDKVKGGYRLDTFAALLTPGKSGAAPVAAGDPAHSDLHARLVHADPGERMPYDAPPLAAPEIAAIRRWIAEGARFDGVDTNAPLASLRPRPVHPAPPAHYPATPPVTALAWRPDGAEIVLGGRHELLFLNPTNLAVNRRAPGFPERVAAFAWSPDGAWLSVAGGAPGRSGEVLFVAPAATNGPRTLAVTRDLMLAAALSPDGGTLAAAGADGTVRLWTVTNLAARLLPPHADWVHALAWPPDGRRLATASRDRTARVVDAASGEVIATFRKHEAAVEHAAFSTDGNVVLTAGTDRRVRFWGAEKPDEAGDFAKFDVPVTALVQAGGFVFIGLSEGTVTQRRLTGRDEVRAWQNAGDRVTALAVDAAGGQLAMGFFSGRVRVVALKDGLTTAEGRPWP
ncbi:MAG: WD40 repeat domain-containing protein [Limisphaerales bacterium]